MQNYFRAPNLQRKFLTALLLRLYNIITPYFIHDLIKVETDKVSLSTILEVVPNDTYTGSCKFGKSGNPRIGESVMT